VGLRWTIGRRAWNCLRSVLALACGSSAVGLSAGGYHSAGGHKNESNTESLEHRVSPQISLTSEEPSGFNDELIFPRVNKSQKAPDLGTEPDQGHALCRRFRGRGGAPGECQISLFRLQRFQLGGKKWGHAPTMQKAPNPELFRWRNTNLAFAVGLQFRKPFLKDWIFHLSGSNKQ
jgi:hypothetical protein